MGEAGPEAVMPLKRGRDGSLGVEAHGGGSGMQQTANVYKIEIQQQSSGDDRQDMRHAEETAKQLEMTIRKISTEVVQGAAQYGGSLNPRGAH